MFHPIRFTLLDVFMENDKDDVDCQFLQLRLMFGDLEDRIDELENRLDNMENQ